MKDRSTATLVVIHIDNLYVCDEKQTILHDAFLACRHERIIAIGEKNWARFVDRRNTVIIDARGCCVIPALIDGFYHPENRSLPQIRDDLYWRRMNGVLNVVSPEVTLMQKTLFQQVFYRPAPSMKNIRSLRDPGNEPDRKAVYCCSTDPSFDPVYSFQPLACTLLNRQNDPYEILMSLTRNNARLCHLEKKGMLLPGYEADFLILCAPSFEWYCRIEGKPVIERMIKMGIQIFPAVIRC